MKIRSRNGIQITNKQVVQPIIKIQFTQVIILSRVVY